MAARFLVNVGSVITALIILVGCGGGSTDGSASNAASVCNGSTKADLQQCYKSKDVETLAKAYCEWAKKEADAKDANDDAAKNTADMHTDAIRSVARDLPDAQQDKFRELTEGCKDHN